MEPKKGSSNMRVLVVAIVIAVLGIASGGYFALQSGKAPQTAVTLTSTTYGGTVTVTSTVSTASIVTVSEGTQQAKVATVALGAGASSTPQAVAYDPANNMIYVALKTSGSVAVINASTNAVATTIALPSGDVPVGLAYDPANGMLYVANNAAGCSKGSGGDAGPMCTVPVINTSTNTVASNIPVADTTNGVTVSLPNTIILTSNDDDALFFINGTNSQVTELQNHGAIPDNSQAVAVDQVTHHVLDVNWYKKRTAAQLGIAGLQSSGGCLATNTNSSYCMTKMVGIAGGKLDSVAVNPNTGMIYLANPNVNLVNVVSESTGKDVANITVPSPVWVTVAPDSNLIYVASNSTSTNAMVVISGSTNAILGTIPVGKGPGAIGLDTRTNEIYVANQGDGTVSVIDGTSLLF